MDRRKETRTVTRAVETRIEFSGANLRKRLRLPADARLFVPTAADQVDPPEVDGPLIATFTRTTTKGG